MRLLNNKSIPFILLLSLLALYIFGRYINTKPSPKPVSIPENKAPVNPVNPIVQIRYQYPISDYNNRIKYKAFGQYFKGTEPIPACGRQFTGFHDADDLEISEAEASTDVPVYAIADGTIRQISTVSGYGGLLILQVNLEGQEVTVNYGHVSISSVKVRVGDVVKTGQFLANLGKGCSMETDGERKHLHFAIHKGSQIDLAGYVPTQAELADWLNPKEELAKIGAK